MLGNRLLEHLGLLLLLRLAFLQDGLLLPGFLTLAYLLPLQHRSDAREGGWRVSKIDAHDTRKTE